MAGIRYKQGRATVETDGKIEAMIRRMLTKHAGVIVRELETGAEAVTEGARKRWPRKSGESADALNWFTFIRGNTIGVEIENPAIKNDMKNRVPYHYAYLIKSPKVGRTKRGNARRPWDVLILRPIKKRRRKIAKELAEEIAALVKG